MNKLEEIKIPQETVNDEQVVIVELNFESGEYVKSGDPILSFETSKALIELEASENGYIEYLCSPGEEVNVNSVVASIYDKVFEKELEKSIQNKNNGESQIVSSKAKKLIKMHDLDAGDFHDYDIVTVDIVNDYLDKNNGNGNGNGNGKDDVHGNGSDNENRNLEFEKISNIDESLIANTAALSVQKKREIEYLKSVQGYNTTSSATILVENTNLKEYVSSHLELLVNSALPPVLFEVSKLLKKYPLFNSFYYNNEIKYYKNINIGVAVDYDDGLKVLTIYNTEKMKMVQIEAAVLNKINKYIDRKLELKDLENSTFTITDLSGEGITFFSPLINKGQSAILGISSINEKLGGFFITVTFDHRIMTGKYVAEFLKELRARLETYSSPSSKIEENRHTDKHCDQCKMLLSEDAELDGAGFIKIVSVGGDKLICRRCFLGWD